MYWLPPPFTQWNGNLTGYAVFLRERHSGNVTEIIVDATATQSVFTGNVHVHQTTGF